jgi:hypothetical protein
MLYSTVLGLTNTRRGSKPGAMSLHVLTSAGMGLTGFAPGATVDLSKFVIVSISRARADDGEVRFNKRGTIPPDRPSDPTKHRNRLVFRMTHYQPGWKDGNCVKWLQVVCATRSRDSGLIPGSARRGLRRPQIRTKLAHFVLKTWTGQ